MPLLSHFQQLSFTISAGIATAVDHSFPKAIDHNITLLSKIIARLGTWGSLCTCCILRYLMRLGLVGDH